VAQAQASVQAASSRAGAYLSSWGTWASAKRKNWQKPEGSAASSPTTPTMPPTQIWAAEESRPAVTTVSELSKEHTTQPAASVSTERGSDVKSVDTEEPTEEDVQKTQQEDIASQVAAEDPWVQEKI
jgi:hypothetical protein